MKSTNILRLWVCLCIIIITIGCDHQGVSMTVLREEVSQTSRATCEKCQEGYCCCLTDLSRPDKLPIFITVRIE